MDEFLKTCSVESAIGAYNDLYSKYKYMETSFERSKGVYKSKIPEIQQTVELIKVLKDKNDSGEEMTVNYNLCDMMYAKAKVTSLIFIYIYISDVCISCGRVKMDREVFMFILSVVLLL